MPTAMSTPAIIEEECERGTLGLDLLILLRTFKTMLAGATARGGRCRDIPSG